MDSTSKLFDFLLKGLKKSKGISKASGDFSEALDNDLLSLWETVKPIFIKEDPKLIARIEQNPDDEIAQGGLKYQVSKQLQNKEFADLVNPLLEKIEKQKTGDKKINNVDVIGNNNTTIVDSNVSSDFLTKNRDGK